MSEEEVCALLAEMCEADAALLTSNHASALALACATCVFEGDEGGIVLQRGHHITVADCGIGDLVELADGYLIEVGAIDQCHLEEMNAALVASDAAIFVARTNPGLVDLPNFLWACRQAGCPSIVDADEKTSWVPFIDGGAELVTGAASRLVEHAEIGLIVGSTHWVDACRRVRGALSVLCQPSDADFQRFRELLRKA